MERKHFGIMLFLVGSIGYLILSLYLSMNRFNYNGMTGTYAALLGNEVLVPYIIFCAMGVIGFINYKVSLVLLATLLYEIKYYLIYLRPLRL